MDDAPLLDAVIVERPWPGGGTVRVLRLHLGGEFLQIWPADPGQIKALGERLLILAGELEGKECSTSPPS